MLPSFDIAVERVPVRLVPHTYRGGPVYAFRFTSTTTVVAPATLATLPQAPLIAPDTLVTYRLLYVYGWLTLSGERFWIGQENRAIATTTSSQGGFQINNNGQLRYQRGGTTDPTSMQVIVVYAVCRW